LSTGFCGPAAFQPASFQMEPRMSISAAVNDNAPIAEHDELPAGGSPLEAVVSAAVLVATAFRLRDEDALILTLRRLTDAVDALEAASENEVERHAACG
jgi:hypothetical protein